MKVQNTQHFENFSLIQNNPSGASRHLPLHKGGFDFCETTKNRFIDTLSTLQKCRVLILICLSGFEYVARARE